MIPGRGVGSLEEQNVLQSINRRTNPQRDSGEAILKDTLKRKRRVFGIWRNAEKSVGD